MRNLNRILTGKRLPALWLAVLLLVSLFPLQLSAAKNYTVETIPNVRLSDRNNHVSNPDGIIQPQDVDRINRLLQIVEDSLGIEVNPYPNPGGLRPLDILVEVGIQFNWLHLCSPGIPGG